MKKVTAKNPPMVFAPTFRIPKEWLDEIVGFHERTGTPIAQIMRNGLRRECTFLMGVNWPSCEESKCK